MTRVFGSVGMLLFATLALSVVIAGCSRPERPQLAGRRPVIFVGLDGADWQLLDEYVRNGAMPVLASLDREGATGSLRTIHPPLSPLVWTTMMTGTSPLEHRILDFTRFNPRTGSREPITSDERAVPAIWNMANARGLRVAVFGLWATWPAEAVDGTLVSDRMFLVQEEGTPPPGSVWPATKETSARATLDAAERAIDLRAMQELLPWLDASRFESSRTASLADPVAGLRRILVETRLYRDLAIATIRDENPDLTIAYFQGTDAIGHLFAPWAPPRQAGIDEGDYTRYSGVPRTYFSQIDRILGEFRDLADAKGAILVIASDHGFLWRDGRPRGATAALAPTAGKWHRDEGIYVIWDPLKRTGGRPRGSGSVDQICPTLLALLALPAAEGVAAMPLVETSQFAPMLQEPSFNYRRDYRRTRLAATESNGSSEALGQLRALGYLGSGERDRAPAGVSSTRTPGSWNNEGLLLAQQGDHARAIVAFEEAMKLEPESPSAYLNLSRSIAKDDPRHADELLFEAVSRGLPDSSEQIIGRALDRRRAGDLAGAIALLARGSEILPRDAGIAVFRSRFCLEARECRCASSAARMAVSLDETSAIAHALAGTASLCLGHPAAARRSFERSLALDPEQPELRRELAH